MEQTQTSAEYVKETTLQYLWGNLKYRWHSWLDRNKPSNGQLHAMREFKALGYIPLDQEQEDGPNKWMQENVLELLKVFAKQGHSGFSADYCINTFAKVAKFEPLCPLLGTDDEWDKPYSNNGDREYIQQNLRYPSVFKNEKGAYDINGKIFWEWYITDEGERIKSYFTSKDSVVPITFPYTPKKDYIQK